MPDLADLYPGYASHWIDTSVGKIFARSGGSGPLLLLLHGYTQTNVMWHRVAPALAHRLRSARARALSRLLRSFAHPCALRGLSRRLCGRLPQ